MTGWKLCTSAAVALMLANGCSGAQPSAGATTKESSTRVQAKRHAAPASALPQDVAAFIERRDQCDHFRGEEPYDDTRAAELAVKLRETCTGTDAALERLKKKYAGSAAISAKLAGYDPAIE